MKHIEVTYLDRVLNEQGKIRVEEWIESLNEMDTVDEEERKLKEILGEDIEEPSYESQLSLTDDDYVVVEVEAGLNPDDISHYYKTHEEENTTIITKSGSTLKIKEDVNFLLQKLA